MEKNKTPITVEDIHEIGEEAEGRNAQSKEHQEIVDKVFERFRIDKDAKSLIDLDHSEALEEYENVLAGSPDGLANIKNPILFSVVQNKIAEELSAMPDIRFMPVKQSDRGYVAPIKAAYNHSTANSRFNYNLYKCFLWKDITGTGIGREGYVQEVRTVFDLVPKKDKNGKFVKDAEGNPIMEKKARVHYDFDDLMLTCIDHRRFFPDARAEDMETARWTTEIEEVDYDEWRMSAEYDDSLIKENIDMVTPENIYSYNYPFGISYMSTEEQKRIIEGQTSSNRVLLVKHFDKLADAYYIVANGVLVRDTPNPYAHKQIPYVRFVNYEELASFWGRSEYKVLKQNIEEQNFLSNNLADWSKININRPILVGATDFEDEDIEFAPGAIWHLGDVNQVKVMDLGDVPSGIFGLRDVLNSDIVAYTGIDPRALSSSKEETATRSALKQEKFLKRIGMGLRLVDWTALEPFAKMRLANIQQFYSEKRVEMMFDSEENLVAKTMGYRDIRVPDVDVIKDDKGNLKFIDRKGALSFFQAKPDVINAQMDVQAVTGSTLSTSKEVDRQNFNNALQSMAAFPELRQLLNWTYIGQELAKKNGLNENEMVKTAETMEPEIDENVPTEQLLKQAGINPPGTEPEAEPIPEDVATEDILANAGINQPQV